MFEIVKQHPWKETNLPFIVKAGLSGEDDRSFPIGITECIESTGETTATGQQAGFGGGPLYTTYKRWAAEAIAGSTGKSWFWVEAGDSDWNEIAKLSPDIPGAKWQDDSPGVPVGMRPLPSDLISKLGDRIHHPEFADVKKALQETSVMRSFTKLHESIAGQGSTFFAGLPFVIEPTESIYRCTISDWFLHLPEGLSALQTGIDRVNQRFGTAQAELYQDRTGWFWVESPLSKRTPLLWNGKDRFVLNDQDLTTHELSEMAKSGYGFFVPGALWRTIVQQSLLAPNAVVVGPSEAAYWGEVSELFQWAELPFPRLVLRPSFTILSDKYRDFELDELYSEEAPIVKVDRSWEELENIRDQLSQLHTTIGEDLPEHLKDTLTKGFEKIQYQMNRQLELGKRFYDEKSGNRGKRWNRARLDLGFGGEPQERRKTLLEAALDWGIKGIQELQQLLTAQTNGGVYIVREK